MGSDEEDREMRIYLSVVWLGTWAEVWAHPGFTSPRLGSAQSTSFHHGVKSTFGSLFYHHLTYRKRRGKKITTKMVC